MMLENRRLLVVMVTLVAMPLSSAQADKGDFVFSVHGSYMASGELFTATSATKQTQESWSTPDGRDISGRLLSTNVDEYFGGGIRFRYGHKDRTWFGFSFNFADLDVIAGRTSVSDNFDELPYDQVLILSTDVNVQYDLVSEGNTVYVLGGVGINSFDFQERTDGTKVDQTKPALVLGVGYRLTAVEGIDLEFEIRDAISSLDLGDEEERLNPGGEFRDASLTHVWQMSAAWVFAF